MLAVIQNIPVLIYCTRIVHSYVSVIKWYYIIIFKEYINMHSWYSCLYRSISGILPTVCDSDSDCPIHHLKTWGKLSHKTLRRLFSQDLGKKKHQKPLETRVRWDGTYDHTCILMYSWVLWLESLIATYVYICIFFLYIYIFIPYIIYTSFVYGLFVQPDDLSEIFSAEDLHCSDSYPLVPPVLRHSNWTAHEGVWIDAFGSSM